MRRLVASTKGAVDDFFTEIPWSPLRLQEFDGDVVEGGVGFVAGDVGEVAGGVAKLAVGHDQMGFEFALDGVDNVGGAERNVEVGDVVLMEKSGFVSGDAHAEKTHVVVLKD